MRFADRIAGATATVANAAVRTSAFAIVFLAAAFVFAVVTALPAIVINLIAYGIADLFWDPDVSDELTQGLIGFAIAVLFAAAWALVIRRRLHADFPSVAAYIVIGGVTSAIYVMVMFMLVIYTSEFVPNQFNDDMHSGGSLVDQLIFFVDNLFHVVFLDLPSIFEWRVSDISPVTTSGRWLVFLVRLIMTISFAAYITTIIKTAHLRLDQPVPTMKVDRGQV